MLTDQTNVLFNPMFQFILTENRKCSCFTSYVSFIFFTDVPIVSQQIKPLPAKHTHYTLPEFGGVLTLTNKVPPVVCVCLCAVPGDVFSCFSSVWGVKLWLFLQAEINKRLPLRQISSRTLGDFLSTPHHSFIDSSGSASIPSSLIQKLRTAILIALRTVEVFNGLFCSRRIGTCQPSENQSEEIISKMLHPVNSLKYL